MYLWRACTIICIPGITSAASLLGCKQSAPIKCPFFSGHSMQVCAPRYNVRFSVATACRCVHHGTYGVRRLRPRRSRLTSKGLTISLRGTEMHPCKPATTSGHANHSNSGKREIPAASPEATGYDTRALGSMETSGERVQALRDCDRACR